MDIQEFYKVTIPYFGLHHGVAGTPEDEDIIYLWSGAPAKINGKSIVLPTKATLSGGAWRTSFMYHAALEDVTQKPSIIMNYTAKVAGAYWSLQVANTVLKTVQLLASKTEMDALPQQVLSKLMEYGLPEVSGTDFQHIEKWFTATTTRQEGVLDYWVKLRIGKPAMGKDGLRVCTVSSQAWQDINEAVTEDSKVLNDVTMSKRSIKILHAILLAVFPTVQDGKVITNTSTACPAYEVVLRACQHISQAIQFFQQFTLDGPPDLYESVEKCFSPANEKKLMAEIATITTSEGNRATKREAPDGINMSAKTKPDDLPWDPNNMRHVHQPNQSPVQQPDPPQEGSTLPAHLLQQNRPQQQGGFSPFPQQGFQQQQQPVNNSGSTLPSWMVTNGGQQQQPVYNGPLTFMGQVPTNQDLYGRRGVPTISVGRNSGSRSGVIDI